MIQPTHFTNLEKKQTLLPTLKTKEKFLCWWPYSTSTSMSGSGAATTLHSLLQFVQAVTRLVQSEVNNACMHVYIYIYMYSHTYSSIHTHDYRQFMCWLLVHIAFFSQFFNIFVLLWTSCSQSWLSSCLRFFNAFFCPVQSAKIMEWLKTMTEDKFGIERCNNKS